MKTYAVEQDVDYYLNKANIAKQNNMDEVVADNLKKAVKLGVKNYKTYYDLGVAYYRLSKYDKAIKYFKKAQKINSFDPSINYLLGISHANKAWFSYGKAVSNLKKATQQAPENPLYLYTLGLVYVLKDDMEKGEYYVDMALCQKSFDIHAYWFAALIKNKINNYDGAQKVLDEMIKQNHNDHMSYYLKSLISHTNNRKLDAINNYKKYLNMISDAEAYYNLASIYYESQNYPEAEENARKSVDIKPTKLGYNLLGLSKLRQGKKGGLQYFKLAVNTYASFNQKKYVFDDKFHKKVFTSLKNTLKVKNTFPTADYNYAVVCLNSHQYDSARKYFEKALHKEQNKLRKHKINYKLGVLYLKDKKYEKALRHFKTASHHEDCRSEVYYAQALIYEKQNNMELAQKYYKKALNVKTLADLNSNELFVNDLKTNKKYRESIIIDSILEN